jgi:hypothetical protein
MIAAILGIATLLSRWPFQASLLSNHDAVNYALALDHFDMHLHQPQPPGYPLYVLLGRAFNLIWHDHLSALVWLSTVFGGLAVVAVYLVGREMFGRRVGVIAALLLSTSPSFWFQGAVAAPYTIDLFASAMVGWLCYRLTISPGRAAVWTSALAVGLAGAFRLQTIVFLFPLFIYALRQHSWKTIAGAVIVAGGIFGAFFLPAVMLSGGPAAFTRSMRIMVPIFWSVNTLVKSTRLPRFANNLRYIVQYVVVVLGEPALPFTLLGYLTRPHWLRFWRNSRLSFLALWALPTWVVYFLIWPGNMGTILVCVAPFLLVAAVGLDWVIGRARWAAVVGWAALTAITVWNIVVFIWLPQHPFGESYRRFDNRDCIVSIDDYYRTKLSLMSEVPVEGTIVYANAFRHLQYYLPQYHTFSPPDLRRSDPSVVRSILSIDNGMMEAWQEVDVTTIVPPETERIVLFDLPPEILLTDHAVVEKSEKEYTIYVIPIPAGYWPLWTLEGLCMVECN